MNAHELAGRLERLERENRWMKRTGLAVLGLALAVVLIGAAPDEAEVIEARVFRVLDEEGRTRAEMSVFGLAMVDENGNIRAEVGGTGLISYDENGKPRALVDADGLQYRDEHSVVRARVDANGFSYLDENNQRRATLGPVLARSPETGAVTLHPAAVVIYKDDRDMLWMQPLENR